MADLETTVVAYVIGQAGFSNICSSRLYVDRIDPSITTAYPFVILRTVAESPGYAHDGALKDRSVIQFDVHSTSKTTCNSAAAAIVTLLSGFSGTMGTLTIGSCFLRNTVGGWVSDTQTFHRMLQFEISQDG